MAIGGDILIKLGADVAELRTGFADAKKEVSAFNDHISAFGEKFKGIILGAFGGLTLGAVAHFVDESAKIVAGMEAAAETVGLTTDQFQSLTEAAERGGVKTEGFTTAFNRFNKQIGAAYDGAKASIDIFDRLGIKLLDAGGRLRSTADVSQDAAKAILAIEDPGLRAARSMELFGKSGSAMQKSLHDMVEGADALAAKLQERGGIASPEIIAKLEHVQNAFASTGKVIQVQAATIVANTQSGDIDKMLESVERLGRAFVDLSAKTTASGETGRRSIASWVSDSVDEIETIIKVIANFPTYWELAMAKVDLVVETFFKNLQESYRGGELVIITFLQNLYANYVKYIQGVVDFLLSYPLPIKQVLGLVGVSTELPKTLDIKVSLIGDEAVKKQLALVEAAEQRVKAAELQVSLVGLKTSQGETGGFPLITPKPGVSNPLAKDTGGNTNEEKVARMLREMVSRQKAEEAALKSMTEISVGLPMIEVERQIDLQKKIDEEIGKLRARVPNASQALVDTITNQVKATENAATATKKYHEAMVEAESIEKKFGDGQLELTATMLKIEAARTTGRLSLGAYTAAVKEANEASKLQALTARGQVEGFDAMAAGFEAASLRYAKANNSFALGGQVFEQTASLMASALDELVTKGSINFGKLLQSFDSMLIQMAFKAAASKIFNSLFEGVTGASGGSGAGGFLSSIFGGLFGGGGGGGSPTFGGPRAEGGPVFPGKWYTVNERGMEAFAPAVAGRIISNDDVRSLAASKAGDRNVTQNFVITTPDAQSFRRSQRQITRQANTSLGRTGAG